MAGVAAVAQFVASFAGRLGAFLRTGRKIVLAMRTSYRQPQGYKSKDLQNRSFSFASRKCFEFERRNKLIRGALVSAFATGEGQDLISFLGMFSCFETVGT